MSGAAEQVHWSHSLVFRALVILTVGVVVVAVAAMAFFHHRQGVALEERLVEHGHSLLSSLIEDTRESINKGQRQSFQYALDNFAGIDEVELAALFSTVGMQNYRSGEVTVGKPFVRRDDGTLHNPNRAIYEETRGRYQRPDWDSLDAHETPAAQRHIESAGRQGKAPCTDCHIAITDEIQFNERNRAYVIRDGYSEFYYRLPVTPDCVVCHTNWEPGGTGGYLMVSVNNRHAIAQRNENLRNMVGLLAAVLALALLVVAVVFRLQVHRPIYSLVDNLHDLTGGEGDLTRRLDRTGRDEMGLLSRLFNGFVEKVHDIVAGIQARVRQLQTSAAEVGDRSQSIFRNNQEVATELGAIAERTDDLRTISTRVVEAVDRVQGEMDSIVQAIERSRQSSQRNRECTDEVVESVYQFSARMQTVIDNSKQVAKQLEQIDKIAKQTNLLSLNAAIEASRSGEHGRGFAVVAEEVRSLSVETASLTRSINESIGSFIEDIGEAEAMVSTTTGMMQEVSDTSRETDQELSGAVECIGSMRRQIEDMGGVAREQDEIAERIADSIDNASGQANHTKEVAVGLAGVAEQLLESVDNVDQETAKFKTRD